MAIPDNIKKYRELRKLSVPDLAKKMGIGKSGIYNWESGENTPGPESLTALAKALDCSVSDLIGENLTSVDKLTDNKEKPASREGVYQTIVEGHTEYVLIPRSVLNETQLISNEQIKRTWDELAEKNKELERKNKQLDFYNEQFAKLLENLELAPKSSEPKKIK
jgi:transcriptional regulator with XRE-family HTH domain